MKFLLDTHIWLWSLLEPDKLDQEIIDVLLDNQHELFISSITIWETLVLAEKQYIRLNPTADEWVIAAMKLSPVHEIPVSHEIVIKSRTIDLPYEDPTDHFIMATALEYELILITKDEHICQSNQVKIFEPSKYKAKPTTK